MRLSIFRIIPLLILLVTSFVEAKIAPRTKYISEQERTAYFNQHFEGGLNAYMAENWHEAASQFHKVVSCFPCDDSSSEAYYYLGVSYMHTGELDLANEAFSNYLEHARHPQYFEETIYNKFDIAEAFKNGYRRRFIKIKVMPKWMSARTLALTIYDEVILALPSDPIAADALYSKGGLLQLTADYRGSIEEFQSFVRRFPKHEKTPDAYLMIAKDYYLLSHTEFQNPDILALAEINARRFKTEFPKDERLLEADTYVAGIQELYAGGLCSIGGFYERTKRPFAAVLYYRSAIVQFPQTPAAEYAKGRIACLGYDYEEIPDCSESTHMNYEPLIQDAPVDEEESADE